MGSPRRIANPLLCWQSELSTTRAQHRALRTLRRHWGAQWFVLGPAGPPGPLVLQHTREVSGSGSDGRAEARSAVQSPTLCRPLIAKS